MSKFFLSNRTFSPRTKKFKNTQSNRGCKLYSVTNDNIIRYNFSEVKDILKNYHTVLLIHGYNTTLQEAISLAGKIETNLNSVIKDKPVVVVPYCWPSDGKITKYRSDENDANLSGKDLADFIKIILNKTNSCDFVSLSIITHSMGARVLRSCAAYLDLKTEVPFNEIIMVAPDIAFNKIAIGHTGGNIPYMTKRLTIYYNEEDFALAASTAKNMNNRLGRVGVEAMNVVSPNVYQVDCTDLYMKTTADATSHSFYFDVIEFYQDVSYLLTGDKKISRKKTGKRSYEL